MSQQVGVEGFVTLFGSVQVSSSAGAVINNDQTVNANASIFPQAQSFQIGTVTTTCNDSNFSVTGTGTNTSYKTNTFAMISAEDLDLAQFTGSEPVTLGDAREAADRCAIEAALLQHRHKLSEAAAEPGISRVTLYRPMGAHGLRDEKTALDSDADGND